MFSFVDLRLVLLLNVAGLLVRAQGEDDRKFHHCLWSFSDFFFPFYLFIYIFLLVLESGLSLRGWTASEILEKRRKETFEVEISLICFALLSPDR